MSTTEELAVQRRVRATALTRRNTRRYGPPRAPHYLVLALIPAVMATAAWFILASRNLMVDEGYSLSEAHLPFRELLTILWRRELNGGLHTLLEWALVNTFDIQSELVNRLPSLVMYLATCLLIGSWFCRHFGLIPAWVASSAFACTSVAVINAYTARTYALTALLVSSTFVLAVRADGSGLPRRHACWATAAAAAIYAHFFAAPVVLAQFLWLALRKNSRKDTGVATVILAFGVGPLAAFIVSGGARAGQLPPHPPQGLHDLVAGSLDLIVGGAQGNRGLQGLTVTIFAVLAWAGVSTVETRPYSLLALSGIATTVCLAALSAPLFPGIFTATHLSPCLPMVAVLAGTGAAALHQLKGGFLGVGLVMCIAFSCAQVLRVQHQENPVFEYSWGTAVAHVARDASSGSVVTSMVPYEGQTARVYAQREGLTFVPTAPRSGASLMVQSGYSDIECLPAPPLGGAVWVMSSQSPRLWPNLDRAADCAGLRVVEVSRHGFVTLIKLVPIPGDR